MSSGEFHQGSEYASQQEISQVYGATAAWLEHHGSYFLEPSDLVHGQIEGVPITDTSPAYLYKIDGSILRRIVPRATAMLQIGDSLGLRLNLEHFVFVSEEDPPAHEDPSVHFGIVKNQESGYESEDLLISCRQLPAGVAIWETTRLHELKGFEPTELPLDDASMSDRLEDFFGMLAIEEATGSNKLSHDECAALLEITEHLDEIHIAQSRIAGN